MHRKKNLIKKGSVAARVLANTDKQTAHSNWVTRGEFNEDVPQTGGQGRAGLGLEGKCRKQWASICRLGGGPGPGGSRLLVWSMQPHRKETRGLPHPAGKAQW